MLLLRTDALPDSEHWLYELKLDGYRAIAFKRNGMIYLRSRNDNDFSRRYREAGLTGKSSHSTTMVVRLSMPCRTTALHWLLSCTFDTRGEPYDEQHPDEFRAGNHPLVLFHDGDAIGVIRIDVDAPVAIFRRVAIREDMQRQGHGTMMLKLAEGFACERVHTKCAVPFDFDVLSLDQVRASASDLAPAFRSTY
jgi:GNAT superfamily N-acetyltransferase